MKRLKAVADRICTQIVEAGFRDEEKLAARVQEARALCRELFPDRIELFDIIYESRFKRLWEQFGGSGD